MPVFMEEQDEGIAGLLCNHRRTYAGLRLVDIIHIGCLCKRTSLEFRSSCCGTCLIESWKSPRMGISQPLWTMPSSVLTIFPLFGIICKLAEGVFWSTDQADNEDIEQYWSQYQPMWNIEKWHNCWKKCGRTVKWINRTWGNNNGCKIATVFFLFWFLFLVCWVVVWFF